MLKELEIIYQKLSISVFIDIIKVPDLRWKNIDLSKTQGVCYLVCILFFVWSLGKV